MSATADSVNFTESRDGGLPTYDLETPKPESLKNFENGGYSVPTPARPSGESRRHEDEAALAEGEGTQVATVDSTALTTRRPATDGIRTFGGKYLPFAAGAFPGPHGRGTGSLALGGRWGVGGGGGT